MDPRCFFFLVAAFVGAGIALPAAAQDYLGNHLEAQHEARMRQHQQDSASTSRGSNNASSKYNPPLEGPARHAAMSRHHDRYGEILKEHGYKVADQWLADQVAAGR